MAISETSTKSSSGKVKAHCDIFRNVSCFVFPAKGLNPPLKRTYDKTPTDQMSVAKDIGSYDNISGAEKNKKL